MQEFKKKIKQKFSISNLKDTNYPLACFPFDLSFIDFRVNHYCLKQNDSAIINYQGLPQELISLLEEIVKYCRYHQLPFENRYLFLTVDNKKVLKGETQRDDGWHIDGMQGEEVLEKQKADFQFIYCSSLPTLFTAQKFNLEKFDEKKHNLFKMLENQIDNKKIKAIENKHVYLMNPYHVHSCQKADQDYSDRVFIRVSFSHTPVTSVKMTINPNMDYNYPVHSTSGNIPAKLK